MTIWQTSADSTVRIMSLPRCCRDFPVNTVSILSAVWIAGRCPSIKLDKDETGPSRLSVSLSADICFFGHRNEKFVILNPLCTVCDL